MLVPQLAEAIAKEKISHSWLLTGADDLLLEQAQGLAQALLCQNVQQDGQPCGHCPSCKKISNGNHPDLQLIQPEGLSVKIHQTRKMQHYANLESYEGGKQVVIIHQAHTMQPAAANSLLKILEEPPSGLYFILTAPVGDSLLSTILSRLVWVRLPKHSGSAGNALVPPDVLALEEELRADMAAKAKKFLDMLPAESSTLLLFAAGFKEDKKKSISARKQIGCFLEELLLCYRDLAVTATVPQAAMLTERPLPRLYTSGQALAGAVCIEESRLMLNQNINSTLLLSVLFFRLQDLLEKQV